VSHGITNLDSSHHKYSFSRCIARGYTIVIADATATNDHNP